MDTNLEDYYTNSLKNNLYILGCFYDNDIEVIISFFKSTDKKKVFKDYYKTMTKIITESVVKISKDKIEEKVNLFLSENVFHSIDKSGFISPSYVLCETVLSSNILKSFFIDVLTQTVLNTITDYLNTKKHLSTVVDVKQDSFFYILSILKKYQILFMNFYFMLINKYDDKADYILPHHDSKCNMYFSKVRYSKAGAISDQLDDLFEKSIKHEYNKEEIEKLETLMENTKINKLIARKELTLGPNFHDVLKKITQVDLTADERKKYFKELFDLEDIKKEKLYQVYKDEPRQDEFLRFLVDKVLHQTNNISILPLVDNIFEKIFKTDYQHNQLNLQDSDIKFILTLETLHALKTSPIGSNKNITVNLYKDVQSAEINDDKVFFN